MAIVSLTLAGCLTIAPPGFIRNGRHTLYRGWIDFNTLGAPAAFFEEVEHQPYAEERVNSYRWMYNRGPGPTLAAGPSHARGLTYGPPQLHAPLDSPPPGPRVIEPEWPPAELELLPPPPAP